jgi:hypothetical protein
MHNTADTGGGISGPGIPTANNCIIVNNSGGGAAALVGSITNSTIAYNSDFGLQAFSRIANCIIWGNTSTQIAHGQTSPEVLHSSVQGGWPGQGNIDTDPCFVHPSYLDPNGTPDDANDDFWVDGDYHLKSQAGRWDPNSQIWTIDDVTSHCIDAGDPMTPIGHEPFPNGGIVNMGAYGGTAEASKSYFGKPPCETIIAGDINGDCEVNFKDFAFVALHWLTDNTP